VLNDVAEPGIGFDASENEVAIVMADEERHVPRAGKQEVAAAILDTVLSRRSSSARNVNASMPAPVTDPEVPR
jgi:phosphopantothenoylcysteine decarboxylase/phosphopantothenate--cysteine ligase